MTRILFVLLLLTLACNKEYEITYAIKSCNVSFQQVRDHLPIMEKRRVTLYLQIKEKDLDSRALNSLIEEVKQRGVKLIIWPLLPTKLGPWANELNYEAFGKLVKKTIEWLDHKQIPIEYLVINMENSRAQMDSIRSYLEQKKVPAILELLLNNLNRKQFNQSVRAYQQLVSWLHQRGYKVMITTYPFLLDDFFDNDPDIQDLTNVPLSGIAWDALTFTPYRTAYSGDFNVRFTPYMVYKYGKIARQYYGDKARLALGIIGDNSHGPGYTSVNDLSQDISAAKAAGIKELDLFHFGGMIGTGDPEKWIPSTSKSSIPRYDIKVSLARSFVKFIDTILDSTDENPVPLK